MQHRALPFLRAASGLSNAMLAMHAMPSSFLPAPSRQLFTRPQTSQQRAPQYAARAFNAVVDEALVNAAANGSGVLTPPVTSANSGPEFQAAWSRPPQRHACQERVAQEQRELQERDGRRRRTDLRQVQGIGPKNEALLLAKEITSVESLHKVFVNNANGERDNMVAFLQASPPPLPPSFPP